MDAAQFQQHIETLQEIRAAAQWCGSWLEVARQALLWMCFCAGLTAGASLAGGD